MKKTILASLVVMLAAAVQASPVAITFTDASRSYITLPTGLSALPVGSVVRVGNFNDTKANVDTLISGLTAGGLSTTELGTLNTSFQTWQTFTIGDAGFAVPGPFGVTNVAGRFNVNFNSVEAGGFNNEDLYFAFYNVNNTNSINSATAVGLFRAITQTMPNDDSSPVTLGFLSTAIEAVGNAGLYVANANASGGGGAFVAGSTREFRMIDVVPVPEPATAVSLLLGGGLLTLRRRARRA